MYRCMNEFKMLNIKLDKIAFLETELVQIRQERDELTEFKRHADEEVSTLRRVVQHHEQESKIVKAYLNRKLLNWKVQANLYLD